MEKPLTTPSEKQDQAVSIANLKKGLIEEIQAEQDDLTKIHSLYEDKNFPRNIGSIVDTKNNLSEMTPAEINKRKKWTWK